MLASIRPRAGARASASLEVSRGDLILRGLCVGAALLVLVTLAGVVFEIAREAAPAISTYGLSFLGHTTWAPNTGHFGAAVLLFGTGVTYSWVDGRGPPGDRDRAVSAMRAQAGPSDRRSDG